MNPEEYIFIQQKDKEVFIRKDTITGIEFNRTQGTAVITTNEDSYIVTDSLAIHSLHDYYYQRSVLKLFHTE